MTFFVLCPPYHGSTLLSLLLNNHSEVFSLGDTNPTREYDQTCACGDKVSECEFWEHVRERIGWEEDDPLPNMMPQYPYISRHTKISKSVNTGFSLMANEIGKVAWGIIVREPARRFHEIYGNFLRACQDWAPHKAFVDGEKSLLKFMVASSMGMPVGGVIHLVRDPRGYVHSAHKYLPGVAKEQLAMEWGVQHGRIQRFLRIFNKVPVLTVRYEDLAEKPQETMNRIFEFMGLEAEEVICAPRFPEKHHLMGNKMLQSFDGTVRPDDGWQDALSGEAEKTVIERAGTLFKAFGYGMKNKT